MEGIIRRITVSNKTKEAKDLAFIQKYVEVSNMLVDEVEGDNYPRIKFLQELQQLLGNYILITVMNDNGYIYDGMKIIKVR